MFQELFAPALKLPCLPEAMSSTQTAVEKKILNQKMTKEMCKSIKISLPKNLSTMNSDRKAKSKPVRKQLIWNNHELADYILTSRINLGALKSVKNHAAILLAKIITEDKLNEFSFVLHVLHLSPDKIQLKLEGHSKLSIPQEWCLKFKTNPPVPVLSGLNFITNSTIEVPENISKLPFVDYELKIKKYT